MHWIVTPDEMRKMDAHMIEVQGIPGLVLMEHAALGVVEEVMKLLPDGGCAGILCGGGNNGGDGLAVLRQLNMRGISAWAALLVSPDKLKGDAKTQYNMAKNCGLRIEIVENQGDLETLPFSQTDVLVDALFGTGFSKPPEGHYLSAIERMNAAGKPVVAVDIPSGVDGSTGRKLGEAVRADVTVTFQHKKIGHLLFPGRELSGQLRVVPIGMPDIRPSNVSEWEEDDVRALLPERPPDSHKGKNGRALLMAGSARYTGAALLSANAALRAGCGLLYAALPEGICVGMAQLPAAICHPVGEGKEWTQSAAMQAAGYMDKADALAVGPGMGEEAGVIAAVEQALAKKKPLVLDADGLNALARHPACMRLLHEKCILTPHPGEMARLRNITVEEVAAHPLQIAREAAQEWGCTVLLKGATSVIATGQRISLNATGNPGLAKGGSGDVLTGILLALLAQGLPPHEAACTGAYILGCSADRAYQLLGMRMLLPTDVIEALGNGSDFMGALPPYPHSRDKSLENPVSETP